MGTVVPCREMAKAGRARLRERIVAALRKPDGAEAEVGRLIHSESLLAYQLVEIPQQLDTAPWLHVIDRLAKEHAEFEGAELKNRLLGCVEFYIDQSVRKRA